MSTTTKFSGPWHVITDSQGYDNIHHAPADEGDTGDIVATCFQDAEHALLIASAPELLTALIAVMEGVDGARSDGDLDCSTEAGGYLLGDVMNDAVDAARAALAKARGEA